MHDVPEQDAAAESSPARRRRRAAERIKRLLGHDGFWALLCLVTLTSAFFLSTDRFGSTAVIVGDSSYYYAYLPSLVFDHDLDLSNQYLHTGNWYRFGITPTGLPSNVFGIGPALFALPFFLVGVALAKLAGVVPTGFGVHEMKATLFASAAFTALAAWPAARLIRRRFPGGTWFGWLVAGATLAGTSAAYYGIRQPGYAHAFVTFWVAAFVNHWDAAQVRATPRGLRFWVLAGTLFGAALLARPQTAPWGILLVASAWHDLRLGVPTRRLAVHLASGAAAALVVFFPQLFTWKVMYGGWFTVPQGAEFMRWDAPAVSAVLFASRNGLVAFTPLVALCLLGFLLIGRRRLDIGLALVAGVAAQLVVNGAAWDWWGGGAYGGRRFDSCFVAFSFGLAAFTSFPARAVTWVAGRTPDAWERRGPRWAARAAAALASLGLAAWAFQLVGGNVALMSRISAPNLVSDGGTPLYARLRELVPKPWTAAVVGLSRWSTEPARRWFAWRHGASREAFDWCVGKHFLGELYPGLNSRLPARTQGVSLHISQPFIVGHVPGQMPITPQDGHLRLLLPLNRKHGPLAVRLDLDRPLASGQVGARWNGAEVALGHLGNSVSFVAPTHRRGTNQLDLQIGIPSHVLGFALAVEDNGLP